MRRRLSLFIVSLGASGLYAVTGYAQTLQEEELEQPGLAHQQPATGDWSVNLGPGLVERPVYPGASRHEARFAPLFSVDYRHLVFLGPAGLGLNAIDSNGLRAGPVIGLAPKRDQDDDPRLNGLGDIQRSITAGAFAAYRFGPFELLGTARQAVSHSSNGLTGLVRLDYRAVLIPRKLELAVGPDLEFADRRYDRTWFGVTPEQSAQSGLPVFTADSPLLQAGVHATMNFRFSEHIFVRTFATAGKLTGDLANSPIVQDRTQVLVGTGFVYHF